MIQAYISTLYGTILFLIVILRRDKDNFDEGFEENQNISDIVTSQ